MYSFGPEALVFDVFGHPTFAPLPGEWVDEYGRPLAHAHDWDEDA